MARISVCLTHYGRNAQLAATLESLANQTRKPDEVFLWDDHSPEDPAGIAERFRHRFRHFVYRRNEQNLGMPGNLNSVLAQATGDYVANLHDADLFAPQLLEKWTRALDAHRSAAFVFCRVAGRNQSQDRRLLGCPALTPGREFNRRYLLNSWRGSSPIWGTVMARRSLYRRYLPFEPRFGCVADVDMWMRLSMAGDVAFVDEALIEADPESHFVSGVNWSLVHGLRRLHSENVARFSRATGRAIWPLILRHEAIFAGLNALCLLSLLRRGRWSELGGVWRTNPGRSPVASGKIAVGETG
jgi:glycosyltransferase involved in cell wall biosynthesis